MKNKIIISLIAVLLFTQIPIIANASNDITYKDSSGYEKSVLQHIVETEYTVSSIKNGTYQTDKEYVKQLKLETGDMFDSFKKDVQATLGGEMGFGDFLYTYVNKGIKNGVEHGLDNLKNLWSTLKGKFKKHSSNDELNKSSYWQNSNTLSDDYEIGFWNKETKVLNKTLLNYFKFTVNTIRDIPYKVSMTLGSTKYAGGNSGLATKEYDMYSPNYDTFITYATALRNTENVFMRVHYFNILYQLNYPNVEVVIYKRDSPNQVIPFTNFGVPKTLENTLDRITNNYDKLTNEYSELIKKNPPSMVLQIACGNELINAVYNREEDSYYAKGKKVVFKDNGYVYLGTQECSHKWETPKIVVEDEKSPEKIKITDGTGTEKTVDGINKEKPNCDGVLCWLSSLWDGVTDFISAIAKLGETIAKLLLDFLEKLFHLVVPEDLDFITDSFDGISDTFNNKFAIIGDLKGMFTGLFVATESNPISNISFTVPAANNKEISLSAFSIIDDHVPLLKRIISGVVMLMTVVYVYRKITGTGGVMEK